MTDNKKQDEKEDKKIDEGIAKVYRERLKLLKKGQEYSAADEIPKSVEFYSQYLNALACYFRVEEQELNPKLFDPETDLAELFLLSHVYWDLAKAYDRSPNLHRESIRCLEQFVKFTSGYKYQYANARTMKTFIRKRLAHNPKAFKDAFERIQLESTGCFISSDLFGPEHEITNGLREFKTIMIKRKLGVYLTEFYYQKACPLYFKLNKSLLFQRTFKPLLKLSLACLSKFSSKRDKCRS